MDGAIEKRARELADARFRARWDQIRVSWETDKPISAPGPLDGLDYLIGADEWDKTPDNFIKEEYRKEARQESATTP